MARRNSSGGGDAQQTLRDHSIAQLVKELAAGTSILMRLELQLAKLEMTQKGKQAGVAAGMLGGAGLLALYALGALTLCFIAALATGISVWLAALIVAVMYGVIAVVLALLGRQRIRRAAPPLPQQTIETVKEDVQWAKTRKPSAKR